MIISKNNKKRTYIKEFKASVLKSLEPPTDDTPTSLSRKLNIPRTTIYQWIRKDNDNKKNSYNKPTNKWAYEEEKDIYVSIPYR